MLKITAGGHTVARRSLSPYNVLPTNEPASSSSGERAYPYPNIDKINGLGLQVDSVPRRRFAGTLTTGRDLGARDKITLQYKEPVQEMNYREQLKQQYRGTMLLVASGIIMAFVFEIYQLIETNDDWLTENGLMRIPAFPLALTGVFLTIIMCASAFFLVLKDVLLMCMLILIGFTYLAIASRYTQGVFLLVLMFCNAQFVFTHKLLLVFSTIYALGGLILLVFAPIISGACIIFLLCTTVLLNVGNYKQETRLRSEHMTTQKINRLNAETQELRHEVVEGTMDKFGVQLDLATTSKFDLKSPVEKTLMILQDLTLNHNLERDTFDALKQIIVYLCNSEDIFKPSLDKNSKPLDTETERYLGKFLDTRDSDNTITNSVLSFKRSSQTLTNSTPSFFMPMTLTTFPGATESLLRSDCQVLAELASQIDKWDFDIFNLTKATNGHPIIFLGTTLFDRYNLYELFGVDKEVFELFLLTAEQGYQKMPYHNSTHGADVTRTMHYFLTQAFLHEYCTPEELFAVIIACIIHDYDHPGRNNAYQIATANNKALLYNDIAVLENHHVSQLFFITKDSDKDIFANMDPDTQRRIRKMIIDLVLITDLGKHFSFVAEFKSRCAGGVLHNSDKASRMLLLQMCIKCCDLSHVAKPIKQHIEWSTRITDEFYCQGDDERKNDLEVSPFMDRSKADLPKSQLGFMNFLVCPMWEEFMKVVDPHKKLPCLRDIALNKAHWEMQLLLAEQK